MSDVAFAPLLLAPYDQFVCDDSLARVARKASNLVAPTKCCLLSALEPTNAHMLVSSVERAVLDRIASTLAPWAKSAWVIVLAYPNHAYAIDMRGKPMSSETRATSAALREPTQLSYIPYRWSSGCEYAISTRMAHFMPAFKRCRVSHALVASLRADVAALKESLQSELTSNERLTMREKSLVDARKSIALDRRTEARCASIANKALARELADVERELFERCAGYAAELAALRSDVAAQTTVARTPLTSEEREKTVVVLKVAVQCHHYFTHDRFSSTHMRLHILVEQGRETLPLSVLASFPRLMTMCGGDLAIIRSACDVLHMQVVNDRVVFDE